MFDIFRKSISVGVVTQTEPEKSPPGFFGPPSIDPALCAGCEEECVSACPVDALSIMGENGDRFVKLSLADCTFCGWCLPACPTNAVKMTGEFRLAVRSRAELERKFGPGQTGEEQSGKGQIEKEGAALSKKIRRLFGRSLHIREVDAGSCNGCEVEVTALNNPVYDLERFGIHFVASPRHADMLLVTGPVSRNMEVALAKTLEATPRPRLVVAVGSCACGGGVFKSSYATIDGVDSVVPVDVYIPGCPPRPEAIIHGLMLALDKLETR
jgi:Ni,Fe-hydrogenase III small subunit/formate hydrogenlyase subunit 6/NADH:ubiquinone oxidoreductase subunit I